MILASKIVVSFCIIICSFGHEAKNLVLFDQLYTDAYRSLHDFVDLIDRSPEQLCKFITCQEPTPKNECPEGTLYVENIAQFGCCGSCVQYAEEGETCTGSIDETYNGGYGQYPSTGTKTMLKQSQEIEIREAEVFNTGANVIQDMWCDYFLACGNGHKCAKDPENHACRTVQLFYDEDIEQGKYVRFRDEYRWRPECDAEGYYSPKQCKGSTEEEPICVCVDRDGNSIYGKAFSWQTELFEDMNCLCSRLYSERVSAGETTITLHCKENGNFDPLQCEKDWCLCVNETTGEPVSQVVPQLSVTLLPCFNRSTEGSMYLRKCDSEYHAQEELFETLKGHGVQLPSSQLNCDPDGSYAGRQCTGSACACFDKFNAQIAAPSPADSPDCNCILDQTTYSLAGHIYELECDNAVAPGIYLEHQQIGNLIFCVDSDGVRNSPKLRSECLGNLYCSTAEKCQTEGSDQCVKVCLPECPDDAYFYNENFKDSGECVILP